MSRPFTMTVEDYHESVDADLGYCLACGEPRDCCEPDARNYRCESCGALEVFGTQELLLMGQIEIVD